MSQLVAALRRHERAVEEARRKVDTRRESSIEINPGAVPIQQRVEHPRLDTDGYSCVVGRHYSVGPDKFGFAASETTVSRYVRRFHEHNPDPDLLKRWITFLRNHKALFVGIPLATVAQPRLRLDSSARIRF